MATKEPGELCMSHDFTVRERTQVRVFSVAEQASLAAAREIAALVRSKPDCVLGLATGSTPTRVYEELIRLHREEGLSFARVRTFNLDEYCPMKPHHLQSYRRFMQEMLFDYIDIKPENTHVPDGTCPQEKVEESCRQYEEAIAAAGGIDLQILGIGRSGHIGFNEPGSSVKSTTRLVYLDKVTRRDAASDFFGQANVPHQAITMGIGSILRSRRILLLAFGEAKCRVLYRAVEEPVTDAVAASFLQTHPSSTIYCDISAASRLTRIACPWVLTAGNTMMKVDFTPEMARKAVIWLSQESKKPVLRLQDDDYRDHHLTQLIDTQGPAHVINLRVYRALNGALTGWPGGRTSTETICTGPLHHPTVRGEVTLYPAIAALKRVLVFSPHPDDDVISMGGTLIRLCDQGHEVHTAYQTSGNIAVLDDDAIRFCSYVADHEEAFGAPEACKAALELKERIKGHIAAKCADNGWVDSPELLRIKGLIRRNEAISAARFCGVVESNVHFLNMPFYQTGTVRKNPITNDDVKLVLDLIRKVKPHQIYAAGDLTDPHGTHRMCLKAVLQAIDMVKNEEWFKGSVVWLYRGAWEEWEPERVGMAVPMSPEELYRKRLSIFRHQSQKDPAPFPGSDPREFWERAEARNHNTAKVFDSLGQPEYEAVEAFVAYDPFNPSSFASFLLN